MKQGGPTVWAKKFSVKLCKFNGINQIGTIWSIGDGKAKISQCNIADNNEANRAQLGVILPKTTGMGIKRAIQIGGDAHIGIG